MVDVTIRRARPDDAAPVAAMIHAHAAEDEHPGSCRITAEDIRAHGFGEDPVIEALIAERGDEAVGFLLFFTNFSSWEGKPGLFVEDLFVEEPSRGQGIGRRLMAAIAKLAVERGYVRIDWSVLEDARARDFYQGLGAVWIKKWLTYRLTGEALGELGASAPE